MLSVSMKCPCSACCVSMQWLCTPKYDSKQYASGIYALRELGHPHQVICNTGHHQQA
jgi:hypothetical protein